MSGLYLLGFICLAYSCTADNKYFFKSVLEKKSPASSIFQSIPSVNSAMVCGRYCKENDACLSASFCGTSCHLSSETEKDAFHGLESDGSCVFMELRKQCVHGGMWNTTLSQCEDCNFGFSGLHCERRIYDCIEGQDLGYTKRTAVAIQPLHAKKPFMIICVFNYGVAEFEHRGSKYKCGSFENFNRTWIEYKYGFGDLECEYFIGLENLHHLTTQRSPRLKVNICGINTDKVNYYNFVVDSEANEYTMHYSTFKTTIDNPGGDGFAFGTPNASSNHSPFCTPDKDCGSCARDSASGWWFGIGCTRLNLHVPLDSGGSLEWLEDEGDNSTIKRDYFFLQLYKS